MANTLMILNTRYIALQFNELQLSLKYICTRREISGDEQHLYEDLLTAFESFPFINKITHVKNTIETVVGYYIQGSPSPRTAIIMYSPENHVKCAVFYAAQQKQILSNGTYSVGYRDSPV